MDNKELPHMARIGFRGSRSNDGKFTIDSFSLVAPPIDIPDICEVPVSCRSDDLQADAYIGGSFETRVLENIRQLISKDFNELGIKALRGNFIHSHKGKKRRLHALLGKIPRSWYSPWTLGEVETHLSLSSSFDHPNAGTPGPTGVYPPHYTVHNQLMA